MVPPPTGSGVTRGASSILQGAVRAAQRAADRALQAAEQVEADLREEASRLPGAPGSAAAGLTGGAGLAWLRGAMKTKLRAAWVRLASLSLPRWARLAGRWLPPAVGTVFLAAELRRRRARRARLWRRFLRALR